MRLQNGSFLLASVRLRKRIREKKNSCGSCIFCGEAPLSAWGKARIFGPVASSKSREGGVAAREFEKQFTEKTKDLYYWNRGEKVKTILRREEIQKCRHYL